MLSEDQAYFAQQLLDIIPRVIPTSFGDIFAQTAGMPGQALIIVVHGSGPKNSSDQYLYLLHQYLVKISYLSKFYIVAIDCPGYGRSGGSKEAVKTFPLKMYQEILKALKYKNYFAMFGHSQGGASIFNAVFQDPSITQFLVMDRPVCGSIQRFRNFTMPTLLIYDIQDDGHPIWQGKLLYKELLNTQLFTYKNSQHPFWVPDNIWQKMLYFFSKQFKYQRKYQQNIGTQKKNRSLTKSKSKQSKKRQFSADKVNKIKKRKQKIQKLQQIEEIEQSQLLSIKNFEQKQQIQFFEKQNKIQYEQEIQIKQNNEQIQIEQQIKLKKQTQKQFIIKKIEQRIKQQQQQIIIKQKITKLNKQQQKNKIDIQKQIKIKEDIFKQNNKCAICYQLLYRPIKTNCNHLFCNKCIIQSLLINDKCPLCRAKITKKNENIQLHNQLIKLIEEKDLIRREKQFKKIQTMLKSIVFIQIGNNSRQLQTKQSSFTKTKKKYIWQLFVKQPKNFAIQEVGFNINMGDTNSKPVKIRQAPFVFESRGTFSFACQITIKPKNKEYGQLVTVYRIQVQPGCHSKKIALKKKIYCK